MAWTTYAHMPPAGRYQSKSNPGFVFISQGPGAREMRYIRPRRIQPAEYDIVHVAWIRLNELERIGDLP